MTNETTAKSGQAAPTALDLPQAELTPAMAAYFAKCEEKIGFVPNVLRAYAHAMPKLEAFAALYNDLMRRHPASPNWSAR